MERGGGTRWWNAVVVPPRRQGRWRLLLWLWLTHRGLEHLGLELLSPSERYSLSARSMDSSSTSMANGLRR